jgi:hypothetical protein
MYSKLNDQIRKVLFWFMLVGIALFLSLGASLSPVVHAQEVGAHEPSEHYTITAVTLSDGTIIEKDNINGPPVPPPGFEVERQAFSLPEPDSAAGISTLTVPAFNWVFGCSAVSGAMIAGYYDRVGWSNIYTGPTNGGVMPLDNSSWPTWSDGFATYPNCPLIASKNGVDGRITLGSIDDYWVKYNSNAADPYITDGWTQHTWGDAIGDYMYTSQSAFGNVDGSTTFYNWKSSPTQLSCDYMASNALYDGTLGRKLFYEARGYTVTDCYNQKTDNKIAGGFSFAQFKAEIDAGRPVMLNLAGHTVVGVGYDDSSSLVYIHDTWDYNNHTMTWGGSYSGMALQSVSIVNIQGACTDTTPDVFTFTDQTNVALNTVATSDTITVSGICAFATISISGGTYSINGGAYTSVSGMVGNGNTVTVRQTSSGSYSTTTNATLTIGGVSDTFSVTTQSEPVGSLQLSSSTYTVAESGGIVTITATRTGGSSGAVGISYATSNGTATSGSDYTATSGMLSWANGDTANKTFTVRISNDSIDEANETFTVTLSSPTGGVALGSPSAATVTITDDDPAPTVQFSAASSSGSEATNPAVITVTLSAASGQTVTVNYATDNGSAISGSDYTATSGMLTFNPGDTSKTINVPITNDTAVEGNETFTMTLSSPSNATLGGTTTHTYAIIDDDSSEWHSIAGLTASTPALAWNPSENKLQMVVRASDDTIWTSTFDLNGFFNNDWINIHGLMADTPGLAWNTFTNKLHVVARASDNTLWTATFNSSGTFNNDWSPISGVADSPPALSWNPVSSKLYLVVRASDSTLWVSTFNSSGVFNNDWVNIPGQTASPPALMWNPVANEMQMVVRASDDTMWGSTFSSSGIFNNDWVNIPGRTISPPALVWDEFESMIAMMVRAFDNTMWYSTFSSEGSFNNDWINFPGLTASTPAMAYLPSIGYLEIVVRAADNSMWAILY